MHFTFEQVVSLMAMFAALVLVAWGIIGYVNSERDKLHREIEFVRAKLHDLANAVQRTYAEKDDLDRLERLVMAARYDQRGDE